MSAAFNGLPQWRQLQPVLRSAWRALRILRKWTTLLLILAIGVPLLTMTIDDLPPQRVLRVLAHLMTAVALAVALCVWTVFAFNLLRQNDARSAALVPGHVRTLRLAMVGAAFGLAIVCAALGLWPAWPFVPTLLAVMALCAATVCAMRWTWLWLAFPVAIVLALSAARAGALAPLRWVWHEMPLGLTAAVLSSAVLALRAVVFTGHAGHATSQGQLALIAASYQGRVSHARQNFFVGFDRGWASMTLRLYGAWLRRTLARPGRSVGARLALGAGPQAHWSGVLSNVTFGVALTLLLLAVCELLPEPTGFGLRSGMVATFAMVSLQASLQIPPALWGSRREQALLLLLPGAPRGAALNRWLFVRLAATQLASTLCQLIAVALVVRALDADAALVRVATISLAATSLTPLLVLWLWRDWSRAGAPSGIPFGAMFGAMLVAGGLAAAWVLWLERPWYELLALTLLVLAPLAWWRWQRLSRWPAAWPVGRLG